MEIKRITVIGGGTMGHQIALNAAVKGFDTTLTDSFPGVLDKVANWSKGYLDGRVAKGKMTSEEAAAITNRFHLVESLDAAVAKADLVIEAIVEILDAKKELFAKVAKLAPPEAIIVSNSSTFVPSSMATATGKPAKFANLHYFNPALHMDLVEIVVGPESSPDTIESLKNFADKIGKKSITVQKEIEGFIVNRLFGALTTEAWFLVENGYATVEDIDTAAEKGLGHPMGAFRTMDLAGLDTIYSIRLAKFKAGTGATPPKILEEKVKKGELGRKTGKGFYTYDNK